MTKEVLYTYLGTNGVLTTPIHLEDVYYVRSYRLSADSNKQLTKDGIHFTTAATVSEDELALWYEVPMKGQN